jgi:multisubunit Na+/H+ antiporter MnhB subunit
VRTPLLVFVARLLFLPMLMLAMAALVKGYVSPGGGFAAGAIAGVALLLIRIVFGHDVADGMFARGARTAVAVSGAALALLVTIVPVMGGWPLLQHFPGPGQPVTHFGALEIHTAMLFELGVALLVLAFVLEAVSLIAPDRQGAPE